MSAGTNIFTEYMDDQMLTSMERIQDNSINIRSNIYDDGNEDFLLLFQTKLKLKREAEFVMRTTGVSFTAQEFVNVFRNAGIRGSGIASTRGSGIAGVRGSGVAQFLSNLAEMEQGALRNFSEMEQRALRAESEQRARHDVMQSVGEHNYMILVRHTH
jgi:hypothetical protein